MWNRVIDHGDSLTRLLIYCDGASKGNPGPAAIAVEILNEDEVLVESFAKFLGDRTNNEAEYEALIAALKAARNLTEVELECFLDSQLVVRQLNGEYQVRNPRLQRLWLEVRSLQQLFLKVSFFHVPRTDERIQEVDRLANSVIEK